MARTATWHGKIVQPAEELARLSVPTVVAKAGHLTVKLAGEFPTSLVMAAPFHAQDVRVPGMLLGSNHRNRSNNSFKPTPLRGAA